MPLGIKLLATVYCSKQNFDAIFKTLKATDKEGPGAYRSLSKDYIEVVV